MDLSKYQNLLPDHYLPVCAKCQKLVDRVIICSDPGNAVQKYEVHCHGDVEFSAIGLWHAVELAQKGKGLPIAFRGEKTDVQKTDVQKNQVIPVTSERSWEPE